MAFVKLIYPNFNINFQILNGKSQERLFKAFSRSQIAKMFDGFLNGRHVAIFVTKLLFQSFIIKARLQMLCSKTENTTGTIFLSHADCRVVFIPFGIPPGNKRF